MCGDVEIIICARKFPPCWWRRGMLMITTAWRSISWCNQHLWAAKARVELRFYLIKMMEASSAFHFPQHVLIRFKEEKLFPSFHRDWQKNSRHVLRKCFLFPNLFHTNTEKLSTLMSDSWKQTRVKASVCYFA